MPATASGNNSGVHTHENDNYGRLERICIAALGVTVRIVMDKDEINCASEKYGKTSREECLIKI